MNALLQFLHDTWAKSARLTARVSVDRVFTGPVQQTEERRAQLPWVSIALKRLNVAVRDNTTAIQQVATIVFSVADTSRERGADLADEVKLQYDLMRGWIDANTHCAMWHSGITEYPPQQPGAPWLFEIEFHANLHLEG